jgi:UDP:flavonoid glycosyltransferase YjiC (YdhE family)
VAIPLFGDQPYNAIAMEYTGMAVRLNSVELSGGENAEELIVEALKKVRQNYNKKMASCYCLLDFE